MEANEAIKQLLAAMEAELDLMSEDEKDQLAGGYDNRGLDCISQRWYGPDRLKGGALYQAGQLVLEIDNILTDHLRTWM